MSYIPWKTKINFASALLLHSCITVLVKEAFNILEIFRRLSLRRWHLQRRELHKVVRDQLRTSIVLDAYTSIFSRDRDGDLAELYFTNTGFVLLAISLASSVAMNILLSSTLLNTIVATTFGVTFLASFVNGAKEYTLPIMALRRAGRFIWSDTPFVNFFSLIYIATVLHGQSTLRLQDYITFRSIAVLELVFMKAKLAASTPEKQMKLLRQLIESEWVAIDAKTDNAYLDQPFSTPHRNDMIPFTTRQRLSVMLFKTTIGFHLGCLQGLRGPSSCPLPKLGCYVDVHQHGWKLYRVSDDIMLISDCLAQSSPKGWWAHIILRAHGVLLRRLGKIRVIYLLRVRDSDSTGRPTLWHSNINLVTGVNKQWLDEGFQPAASQEMCVIGGDGHSVYNCSHAARAE